MQQLNGTRVLVMGLGVHGGGLGVARWLLRQRAEVTITDMADPKTLEGSLAALHQTEAECGTAARYVLGEHRAEDFTGHAIIVANPAVRSDSPWLAMARAAGATIETEMTLFFRHCPGPILGITGTKGKTTTTMLTGAMLRRQSPDAIVAGNLRVSALDALERITPTTPVVLELSSFQLGGLGEAGISPRYACVTNLSPDHLNYHGTMEEYAHAKQQIFAHQSADGIVVLNQDLRESPITAAWFADARPGQLRTFSPRPNDEANCRITQEGEVIYHDEVLFNVSDIRLTGEHNRANVLAATALAREFGVTAEHIRAAVREFTGVEHRMEIVREIDGVTYINDTTATNPSAAQAALASVTGPIVLLAGGADKRLAFDELARAIVQRVKVVILLDGNATDRLQNALSRVWNDTISGNQTPRDANMRSAFPHIVGPFDNLTAAIQEAQRYAMPGDAVLLSPGCASFGMFRNEFHRGEEFRRLVHKLRTDET